MPSRYNVRAGDPTGMVSSAPLRTRTVFSRLETGAARNGIVRQNTSESPDSIFKPYRSETDVRASGRCAETVVESSSSSAALHKSENFFMVGKLGF